MPVARAIDATEAAGGDYRGLGQDHPHLACTQTAGDSAMATAICVDQRQCLGAIANLDAQPEDLAIDGV